MQHNNRYAFKIISKNISLIMKINFCLKINDEIMLKMLNCNLGFLIVKTITAYTANKRT